MIFTKAKCPTISFSPSKCTYLLFLDFDFHDFDGDGIDEIISAVTTNYDCWGIEIYKLTGEDFMDVSDGFFAPGENIGHNETWVSLIDFHSDRGKLVCQQHGFNMFSFEYKGGRFVMMDTPPVRADCRGRNTCLCRWSEITRTTG